MSHCLLCNDEAGGLYGDDVLDRTVSFFLHTDVKNGWSTAIRPSDLSFDTMPLAKHLIIRLLTPFNSQSANSQTVTRWQARRSPTRPTACHGRLELLAVDSMLRRVWVE